MWGCCCYSFLPLGLNWVCLLLIWGLINLHNHVNQFLIGSIFLWRSIRTLIHILVPMIDLKELNFKDKFNELVLWFLQLLSKLFKYQMLIILFPVVKRALKFMTWYGNAAAAAAKLLQSCPTLCNPIPGILQARTLVWVAISFSNAWKWKLKVKSLSRVWLLGTLWTAAYQAPLSMRFSRQEYWSGVPLKICKTPLLDTPN